jgi:hypothetical protein
MGRQDERNEPTVMTTWPPWRSIMRPTVGAISPAASRPTDRPLIAKASDQPCSAAIGGTVNTGG